VAYEAAGEAARHDRAFYPDPSDKASGRPSVDSRNQAYGYRLIARKREGRVRLFTRNGFDWSDRYPRISVAVAALRALQAVIDGEAVWCDGQGLAILDKVHSRAYDGEVILYAFDLLELHGEDWQPRPLEQRKARLAKLLAKAPAGVHYTEPGTETIRCTPRAGGTDR
jgi:ATP-dependent DNA ligase